MVVLRLITIQIVHIISVKDVSYVQNYLGVQNHRSCVINLGIRWV